MPFRNGEIWCEELDSFSIYTDIVKEKFLNDMEKIRKPSSPAFIAMNLNETLVDKELAELIVNELSQASRYIKKVAFIGLDRKCKKLITSLFSKANYTFVFAFINDFEKAKEWLINKNN